MAKKRRGKARARKANPKKRVHHRKKNRRAVANPKRSHARKRRHNPRKRSHARKRRSNPIMHSHAKRRHAKRRRKNPGGFAGDLALALLAGLAAFAGTFTIGYFVTPADQMASNGQRNRGIVGAGIAGLSAWYAKKNPMIGVGGLVGSILGAFGGAITLKVLAMLPPKQLTQQTTSAVFSDNMSGYNQISGVDAVFSDNMSAVFSDNMAGMGGYNQISGYHQMSAIAPPAPWEAATPFDSHEGGFAGGY